MLEPLLVEKKHVDVTRTIPSLGLFFCVNEEGHVQRLVIYVTLLVEAIISKGWAVNAVTACRVSCGACCSTCCPRRRLRTYMLTAPPAVYKQVLQLFCYSRNVSAVKGKKKMLFPHQTPCLHHSTTGSLLFSVWAFNSSHWCSHMFLLCAWIYKFTFRCVWVSECYIIKGLFGFTWYSGIAGRAHIIFTKIFTTFSSILITAFSLSQ